MALSFRHVHVADVYLLYRHTALDERKHVFRCFGHDEDLLARARLANDVDGLLQREETRSDAGGSGHLHEVLAHGVGAQGGVPLGGNLTMNQSVIDAGKKNVGFCHVDQLPFVIC